MTRRLRETDVIGAGAVLAYLGIIVWALSGAPGL